MSEEQRPKSYIIEDGGSQAPPVSEVFQEQLAEWTTDGLEVSQSRGGLVTRVFVFDGSWTHIFDEKGKWIRSTDR